MSVVESVNKLSHRMDCRVKPGNDEVRTKEKEAERRQTHCRQSRTSGCGRATERSACADPSAVGRARLPAYHHGSCQREYLIPKARPGPGFVGQGAARALPAVTRPLPAMHPAPIFPASSNLTGPTTSHSIRSAPNKALSDDLPHTGKLSCLRPGISTVLPRSIAKARARRGRVALGMITSSI
jgi:hypothetical protein